MNLCFDALDIRVIRGAAGEPAVRAERGDWDVARLLEEVAALGGAMRGLGVVPGSRVPVDLTDPRTRLVACLAALRLGAVPVLDGSAADADLLVVDAAPPADVAVPAVLVDSDATVSDVRDLTIPLALRAGRTDPAPVADPLPGAPAYVVGEREVHLDDTGGAGPEADSFLGAALADLLAGRPVDLRGDGPPRRAAPGTPGRGLGA